MEQIDGLDDGPPPPSGGEAFSGATNVAKNRAKGDFPGLLLSNQTHRSKSNGEARLFRKSPGVGASLSFMSHCIMETRNGLVVASEVSQATGMAERDPVLRMVLSLRGTQQKTLEVNKGNDTREFAADLGIRGIEPHVDQNIQAYRSSPIDASTVRHSGYAQSINARKRMEQIFAWIQEAADLRQHKARTWSKLEAVFRLHVVGYKLIRITNLLKNRR